MIQQSLIPKTILFFISRIVNLRAKRFWNYFVVRNERRYESRKKDDDGEQTPKYDIIFFFLLYWIRRYLVNNRNNGNNNNNNYNQIKYQAKNEVHDLFSSKRTFSMPNNIYTQKSWITRTLHCHWSTIHQTPK